MTNKVGRQSQEQQSCNPRPTRLCHVPIKGNINSHSNRGNLRFCIPELPPYSIHWTKPPVLEAWLDQAQIRTGLPGACTPGRFAVNWYHWFTVIDAVHKPLSLGWRRLRIASQMSSKCLVRNISLPPSPIFIPKHAYTLRPTPGTPDWPPSHLNMLHV